MCSWLTPSRPCAAALAGTSCGGGLDAASGTGRWAPSHGRASGRRQRGAGHVRRTVAAGCWVTSPTRPAPCRKFMIPPIARFGNADVPHVPRLHTSPQRHSENCRYFDHQSAFRCVRRSCRTSTADVRWHAVQRQQPHTRRAGRHCRVRCARERHTLRRHELGWDCASSATCSRALTSSAVHSTRPKAASRVKLRMPVAGPQAPCHRCALGRQAQHRCGPAAAAQCVEQRRARLWRRTTRNCRLLSRRRVWQRLWGGASDSGGNKGDTIVRQSHCSTL